jgi:hypothetical protein
MNGQNENTKIGADQNLESEAKIETKSELFAKIAHFVKGEFLQLILFACRTPPILLHLHTTG